MWDRGRAAAPVERWTRLQRWGGVAGVCAGVCLLAAAPSRAQDATLQQEILFQQTLSDPANIEASFAFARVATANGDYEAAIGALERILFFQPGLRA